MSTDILEGKWEQLKGKTQQQWGELTNDDLDVIEGNAQELIGRIQERYGIEKAEAEEQVRDWLNDNQ